MTTLSVRQRSGLALLLLALLSLSACGAPPAVPAATATPAPPTATLPPKVTMPPPDTATPVPTPTETPVPTATPTRTPVPDDVRASIEQAYKLMVFTQAAANLLLDTATEIQAGELDGFEAFAQLLVAGVVTKAVAETEADPVPVLEEPLADVLALNHELRLIVSRWFDKEITSLEVLDELPPLQEELEDVIGAAEAALQAEYGFDADAMRETRREALEDFNAMLEATPTPTVAP